MGRFTDDQPLPAMPKNGMPGITSNPDDDYGPYEGVFGQNWGGNPEAGMEHTMPESSSDTPDADDEDYDG